MTDKKKIVTLPGEPRLLSFLKFILYLLSIGLYLGFLTDIWATYLSMVAGGFAFWVARFHRKSDWTLFGQFLLSLTLLAVAYLFGKSIEHFSWVSGLIGPGKALRLSEIFYCAWTSFALVFFLRSWGQRTQLGALVESCFALGSVLMLFASHRMGQIHEPRFFADWALINGYDLTNMLKMFGFAVAGLALIVMTKLRSNRQLIFAISILIALIFGLTYFDFASKTQSVAKTLNFDSSQGDEESDSDSDSDSDSKSNSQSSSSSSNKKPPEPVAIAIFHEDYEQQLYYFRQQVLSYFDGTKLVSDLKGEQDQDVLTTFPLDQPLKALPVQSEDYHTIIPTSMFLIAEHATPPALTNAISLKPMDNPNPNRFVRAYDVQSMVPTVQISRLYGLESVPKSWSEAQRQHYLQTPNDPRYLALSNEIVRELPLRFINDPIAKAVAIKRYLETNGYYTLKKKISSNKDPVAPFLFGDMKGYCVHFAHSAVHLLRSQGIAARVALGYLVDNQNRSQSSAVLITGDRAHAWPEIHVEGVGWITFDIYPEESDPIPQNQVASSLESLFGEIARKTEKRGLEQKFNIPWLKVSIYFVSLLMCLIILSEAYCLYRFNLTFFAKDIHQGKWAYLQLLDRLAAIGFKRSLGESREAFALRLMAQSPTFMALTNAHLKWAFAQSEEQIKASLESKELRAKAYQELAKSFGLKWYLGFLNPLAWYFSR
jgi:transglutaminase-like putative cysteine protease